MKRAVILIVLTACGGTSTREVAKFPRSAQSPELERLLPEMKAGFPAERGKALKVSLVHPYGIPFVEAGKTHRRLPIWVGVERGPTCFVEMHDYDQTKTDDGWTPPKWVGHSPREQTGDQDAAIACSELRSAGSEK